MIPNKIPSDIGNYLKYNPSSPTGLSWVVSRNFKIKVGDKVGYSERHGKS